MKRRLKKMLWIACIFFGIVTLGTFIYLQQPKFGTLPEGERLERLKASTHYINNQFENLIPTPQIVGNQNTISASWNYLTKEKIRPIPTETIPVVKTNLKQLPKDQDTIVWLGHSSFFLQLQGLTILVDPVLSESAAPIPFVNKAFAGTNPYTADDFPDIDYLLISHDHWDHLDYPTIMALKPKIKSVVSGLGIGAYFEGWGFARDQLQEGDWYTALPQTKDLTIHLLPARHYSGRLLEKNKTLWGGFALTTPQRKIFYSGDSGYGAHFKEIGEMFGGFDLVILDNGQYDKSWPYIHMTPEEAAQAAADLQAQNLLPVHIGKFSIANHPWDEPFERMNKAVQDKGFLSLTPRIGEPVILETRNHNFPQWWETVR